MQTTMKRTPARRSLISLTLGALVVVGLTGCSGAESKYEGAYAGSSGTTILTLEKDGVATYSQVKQSGTDAGSGTWRIEDETLFVETESLSNEIYADISNSPESLLFESDGGSWSEEIFVKR